MTVSPSRPKDGSRQPSHGSAHVQPGPRQSSNSIPPTLFTLPNLREDEPAETTNKPDHDEAISESTYFDGTGNTIRLQREPALESSYDAGPASRNAPPTGGRTPNNVGSVAAPAQPFVSVTSPAQSEPLKTNDLPFERPATEPNTESPWSGHHDQTRPIAQRIGSHAIVLVMLIIVVSAAMLAGRKTQNNTGDSPASENSVAGTIPSPQSDFAVSVGDPQDVSIADGSINAASSTTESSDSAANAAIGVEASRVGEDFSSVRSMTPNVPASTVSAGSTDLNASDNTASSQDYSTIEPLTAGRYDEQASNFQPELVRPVLSRTPNRITDWSQYFPAPPTGVVPASATTPVQ